MMVKIYSIKDNLKGFGPLWLESSDPSALREFTKVVNKPGNDVSDSFEDMNLYCLGEFDFDSGVISPENRFISRASDVKKVSADEV